MNNKICPNCKVELEEGMQNCPLCGATDPFDKKEHIQAVFPSELLHLSEQKSRVHAWEFSALIAFSAILICLIVDLVIVQGLEWSLYAVTSIAGVWLIITSFTFFMKRPVILGSLIIVVLLVMLIIYDLIVMPVNWFVTLGMPIGISVGILFIFYMLLMRKVKSRGFNILGFILIFTSALCFPIEIFTDLYISEHVKMGWSPIAAVSMLPIAWILLYLHYRLKKGNNLKSFFHV